MGRIVTQMKPTALAERKVTRVAAYARVSVDNDEMLHSLSQQVSYYSAMIQSHPDWSFVGIYADDPITGTKDNRPEFQRMLADCRAGKIDVIYTKSVARFARNTVTLLSVVRELRSLGIGIRFEEQSIDTLTSVGELLLTIIGSYAQEESRNVSENLKWGIRNGFKEGRASTCNMTGYRLVKGEIKVIPDEAKVVQLIFDLHRAGYGKQSIANLLNEAGIETKYHHIWCQSSVIQILTNEKYSGDLLLQKYYSEDHMTKKTRKNKGELPQYLIENDHPAIIERTIFYDVQKEIHRRAVLYQHDKGATSVFSSMIRCGICGKSYTRKPRHDHYAWRCNTYSKRGKKYCPSTTIPEEVLKTACCQALGLRTFDASALNERVTSIEACANNLLRFNFYDGHQEEVHWTIPSRAQSWSEDMKLKARDQYYQRRELKNASNN